MVRSLYSGISGLRNHQTRLDVIGNNIANVNTAGFKASRVIFQDIFSQNLSAGMANQEDRGGTNPMQVGLGIRLSTVDIVHTRAAFQRTDRATDMMINGDGFFIVGQVNPETNQFESFYTRAGNFDIDSEGYLVTSQGFYVLGRNQEMVMGIVDPGGEAVDAVNGRNGRTFNIGQSIPVNIWREGDVIPAGLFREGRAARVAQNIAAAAAPEDRVALTPAHLDMIRAGDQIPNGTFAGQPNSTGGFYTVTDSDMVNTPASLPAWMRNGVLQQNLALGDAAQVTAFPPAPGMGPLTAADLDTMRSNPLFANPVTSVATAGGFRLEFIETITARPFRPPVVGLMPGDNPVPGADANGLTRVRVTANALNIPSWDNLTVAQQNALMQANNTGAQADLNIFLNMFADTEHEVGLPGFAVADNGDISVILGNRKVVIGQLAVAMFANVAGLETAGNSLYRETASSGAAVVTQAFEDGAGRIDGGGLEMSNVDLANEFSDMIVTQRGFQASSRIITVSDTMLEELVNLKR